MEDSERMREQVKERIKASFLDRGNVLRALLIGIILALLTKPLIGLVVAIVLIGRGALFDWFFNQAGCVTQLAIVILVVWLILL